MFDVAAAFPGGAFALNLLWSALGVAAVLGVTFGIALVQKRHSVIDVAWAMGFVVVAAVSFAASSAAGADAGRRLLLLLLVGVWGLRLAGFIGWRARDGKEDPRYEALLSKAPGSKNRYALTRVYLPQGAVLFFVSLTIQVGMFSTGALGWLAWLGVAVWLIGLGFESVGDAQLAAFKADPGNRGTVLNTGLWRYTRHPNYFGDAAVWVGLFLVVADSWPGVLTILSPVLMIWALAGKTGKPVTEARMSGRPGYREYLETTSGFFPLPPRPSTKEL